MSSSTEFNHHNRSRAVSTSLSERIRQAARDGYLEILRNSTRKECNSADEDGMTATHWAAYTGNLNALRIIVGRGGDPEKCDNYGNNALHWCANNGHYKCVSFLISFGVNLWAMDNQYHTAKEIAALNNREEIVQLIDDVVAQQSARNTKVVQKLKEKAMTDAEKRIKNFLRLQSKTAKQAEKEAKQREKCLKKRYCLLNSTKDMMMMADNNELNNLYDSVDISTSRSSQSSRSGTNQSPISQIYHHSPSTTMSKCASQNVVLPKFSDLVNSHSISNGGHKNASVKMKILSRVSRRVLSRKFNPNELGQIGAKTNSIGTCRSVQSMIGIKRDDHIVYVPKFNSLSVSDLMAKQKEQESFEMLANGDQCINGGRLPLTDVFNNNDCERVSAKTSTFNKNIRTTLKNKWLKLNRLGGYHKNKSTNSTSTSTSTSTSNLYRAISEPDFLQKGQLNSNFSVNNYNNHRSNDILADPSAMSSSSIFERPGFGSVSFRGKFTPELMFSTSRYYANTENSDDDDDDDDDNSAQDRNDEHHSDQNDDDFDSGHDHGSRENSQYSNTNHNDGDGHYLVEKNLINPEADSFATDSIGSAGSLAHQDYSLDNDGINDDDNVVDDLNDQNQSKTVSVLLFLYAHGLKDYYDVFESEQIDIDALMLLEESDLIGLGIPLGPRKKLINAIQQRREIFEENRNIVDTRL